MSTSIELLREAGDILGRIMDREGTLDEEDEVILEEWVSSSEDKIEALRAVFHRSKMEAELWKKEQDRHRRLQKRAEAAMAWTKRAGLDLMIKREELGESTKILGVAYVLKSKALRAPDDLEDWPVAYLVEQEPKPDRRAALTALKAGRDLGEGFSIEERPSVIYR